MKRFGYLNKKRPRFFLPLSITTTAAYDSSVFDIELFRKNLTIARRLPVT
jgi:hypothetical protein